MKLIARVWIDGESIFFGRHAAERFNERVCPELALGLATQRLRYVAEQRGRVRMSAPKGVTVGRDLRSQILTESWLVIENEPQGGLTAFPLVCKPGGGGLVATTCVVERGALEAIA